MVLMVIAGCISVVIFIGYIKGDIIVSEFQIALALYLLTMFFFQTATKKVIKER